MDANQTRKHDVAFSFLQRDEPLALRFAAAVAPLTSFIYSKKQEQFAGTDGMESFRAAFRIDSRLNVVLLRTGWGTTKWTRVEETAIHDRCFDDGFGSLLMIRLDGAAPPKWCTDTKIYFDLDTFPFEEAVGAIKRQATQLGSNVRPLTGFEKAQREAKAAVYDSETREFLGSGRGVQSADASVSTILDAVAHGLTELSTTVPRWSPFFGKGPMYTGTLHAVARLGRCSLGINWQRYENTLTDSQFTATLFEGHLSFNKDSPAEKMYGYGGRPNKLTEISFKAGRCPGLDFSWKENTGKWIGAEEVAGRLLEALVKFARQFDESQ